MEIRELQPSEADATALLLGRGMRDNPNNVAAWRLADDSRQRALFRFFRVVLRGLLVRGRVLGAFDGQTLVGVCAMAPPGRCQPVIGEKVRITPTLFVGSPMVALRVLKWTTEWARRDPSEAHWHLGPVAVDAHLQGRGIGGRMMAVFAKRMDELGAHSYLETDKQANVGFYERFGFRVTAESRVLGIPNWYMKRPARTTP